MTHRNTPPLPDAAESAQMRADRLTLPVEHPPSFAIDQLGLWLAATRGIGPRIEFTGEKK